MKVLLSIVLITSMCFSLRAELRHDLSEKWNDNWVNGSTKSEYSGIYEGLIEVSLCCDSYEMVKGKVYINVNELPVEVIFDGVKWNDLIFENNILKRYNDYLELYDTVIIFEKDQIKLKSEDESTPDWYYLKKVSGEEDAKRIIELFNNQYKKNDEFISNLKDAILNRNFERLVELTHLPISVVYDMDLERELITSQPELLNYYKIFFDNEFYLNTDIDDIVSFRHEDSYPEDFIAGKFVIYSFRKSFFIISEIDGDFKIVNIPGVWG